MEIECKTCNKTFTEERFVIFKYGKKKVDDKCRKCRNDRKVMIQFHIYNKRNKLC